MKKIALLVSLGLCFGISMSSSANLQYPSVTANNHYATTRYPIVFVHGMFGFTRLGTSSFGMDYFYQVLPDLARNGANVFATQLSPLESTEVRGEQLLQQIEEVRAITGQDKVNLIGHSHGGPTIRYIEIVKPEYVASLTGVGGTFRGSKVADTVLSSNPLHSVMNLVGNHILSPTIQWAEGNSNLPISTTRSLQSISQAGSAEFNRKYPSAALAASCAQNGASYNNGIYYYSWTGTGQITNLLDVTDSAIASIGPLVYLNRDNDGLVDRCSTHFGKVIRDNYNYSHLDEINQILGMRSIFSPDPVALYRQHANRLKLQGL
ncbi:triacylglycerol lipase [Acinetobacter sp. MD2]|uniref:lipase family alpha/beta hydrolase n=1 Tax=Acinetobacter sp. MD2 TaxID=2600066 RepID=UPI002D1E6011|nr:triacylglycerol lipase [Acinetobacter sp. MD2]MEB3767226.1 triacylglycerol lipase [Acinetobacter sp. MD2]